MTALRRLIVEFGRDDIQTRVLYRRASPGPNPGTLRRRREVEQLTREGLRRTLEALDRGTEDLGTSGFTTREDVLGLPLASRASEKPMKEGA